MSPWKRVLRVVLWVVGGLLALALLAAVFLAITVALDARGSAQRLESVANTTIPGTAGPDVRAYVAKPSTPGPHPAVVMIHEFWGLNPDIVSKADLLAKEGYLVVAPDVFRGSTTGYLPRAIYQVVSTPAEEINQDLDTVVSWVEQQPEADAQRIGIVGFCFGGRSSLQYSLHNPALQGTAVFYGEPVTDPDRLAVIQGPVLGIFGGADNSIPLENVRAFDRALEQAGVESTVTIYPDQPHAFVKNAEGIATDPAQRAAWDEMLRFFRAALQGAPADATVPPGATRLTADSYGWTPLMRLGLSHLGHASPWQMAGAAHTH